MAQAEDIPVVVERVGEHAYRVEARFVFPASVSAVWRCLTDYERLSELLPSVEESRCLGVEADSSKRVFQRLRLQILPIVPVSVQLELRVRERADSLIEFEELRRTYFLSYRGRWELAAVAGGTRVRYVVEFVPRPLVRPLVERSPAGFTRRFVAEFYQALRRCGQ